MDQSIFHLLKRGYVSLTPQILCYKWRREISWDFLKKKKSNVGDKIRKKILINITLTLTFWMMTLLKVAQNINSDCLSKLNSLWAKFLVQNRQVVILHRLYFQILQILGQNLKFQLTQVFGIFRILFWTVLNVSININQNFKWNSFQSSNLKTQNSYIYDKAFIPLVGNTLKLCIYSHSDTGLKYIEQ